MICNSNSREFELLFTSIMVILRFSFIRTPYAAKVLIRFIGNYLNIADSAEIPKRKMGQSPSPTAVQ